MKKRWLFGILCCLVLVLPIMSSAATEISVYVDDAALSFDVAPTIIKGTTLVPMRAIFEAIGADVSWDQETKTATGVKGDNTVSVQINSDYGYKNGQSIKLLQPAQLIDGRTMVPLRFISESLDCTVAWDDATKSVSIVTSAVAAPSPAPVVTPPAADTNFTGKYYVTKSGSRYHYLNNCGNGTYFEATWEEVQKRGLTPCEKCVH